MRRCGELPVDARVPLDLVDVWALRVPVVRVALEHERLVECDRPGELERARADRGQVEAVVPELLDDVARYDARERKPEQVEERAVGLLELHRERRGVDDRDPRQLLAALVEDVLSADNPERLVVAAGLARGGRVDDALERELHVVRRQLAPVVEHDAGAERERVERAFRVHLGELGNSRADFPVLRPRE